MIVNFSKAFQIGTFQHFDAISIEISEDRERVNNVNEAIVMLNDRTCTYT